MWLARAQRIPGNSAGAMNGDGSRKLLLHSTEGSTIEGAVGAYTKNNSWPTLTCDCRQRRVVQHLPLDVAARSLRNLSGGEETNRDGTVLVQVELVGFATNPATIGTAADLEWFGREVVRPICDLTGIPVQTSVAWLSYPASYGASPVRLPGGAWDSYSGLLGHMHAPENLHGDPGAIDIFRILNAARGTTQEDDMLTADDKPIITAAVSDALKLMTRNINGVGGGRDADAVWAKYVYDAARESLADMDLTPAAVADAVMARSPQLAEAIATELGGSADVAQVEAALRLVFADAATPGE